MASCISRGLHVMEPLCSPARTLSSQRISGSVAALCRYSLSSIVARGLLLLAGVVGIVAALPRDGKPRKAIAILLALAPVGLIVLGLFTLESPAVHLSCAMLVLAPPADSFLTTGM